jgi:hypothetical protein
VFSVGEESLGTVEQTIQTFETYFQNMKNELSAFASRIVSTFFEKPSTEISQILTQYLDLLAEMSALLNPLLLGTTDAPLCRKCSKENLNRLVNTFETQLLNIRQGFLDLRNAFFSKHCCQNLGTALLPLRALTHSFAQASLSLPKLSFVTSGKSDESLIFERIASVLEKLNQKGAHLCSFRKHTVLDSVSNVCKADEILPYIRDITSLLSDDFFPLLEKFFRNRAIVLEVPSYETNVAYSSCYSLQEYFYYIYFDIRELATSFIAFLENRQKSSFRKAPPFGLIPSFQKLSGEFNDFASMIIDLQETVRSRALCLNCVTAQKESKLLLEERKKIWEIDILQECLTAQREFTLSFANFSQTLRVNYYTEILEKSTKILDMYSQTIVFSHCLRDFFRLGLDPIELTETDKAFIHLSADLYQLSHTELNDLRDTAQIVQKQEIFKYRHMYSLCIEKMDSLYETQNNIYIKIASFTTAYSKWEIPPWSSPHPIASVGPSALVPLLAHLKNPLTPDSVALFQEHANFYRLSAPTKNAFEALRKTFDHMQTMAHFVPVFSQHLFSKLTPYEKQRVNENQFSAGVQSVQNFSTVLHGLGQLWRPRLCEKNLLKKLNDWCKLLNASTRNLDQVQKKSDERDPSNFSLYASSLPRMFLDCMDVFSWIRKAEKKVIQHKNDFLCFYDLIFNEEGPVLPLYQTTCQLCQSFGAPVFNGEGERSEIRQHNFCLVSQALSENLASFGGRILVFALSEKKEPFSENSPIIKQFANFSTNGYECTALFTALRHISPQQTCDQSFLSDIMQELVLLHRGVKSFCDSLKQSLACFVARQTAKEFKERQNQLKKATLNKDGERLFDNAFQPEFDSLGRPIVTPSGAVVLSADSLAGKVADLAFQAQSMKSMYASGNAKPHKPGVQKKN